MLREMGVGVWYVEGWVTPDERGGYGAGHGRGRFAPQTIIITITDPPPQSPKVTTARGAADGSGEAWSRR